MKILFLSDTHLGFDFPFRPRIKRRRRGVDFFSNFERALQKAYNREVDCVIHGGDILYRSKVPAKLVQMAFEPLIKAADLGIPVIIVPGNHERSVIPYRILAAYNNIYIFDKPETFIIERSGMKIAFAGFPYEKDIRANFRNILANTNWKNAKADGYFLCLHHCIEGASVGPRNYTFKYAGDVVKASELPGEFSAVLSGHIHRHQVLEKDLKGKSLPVKVYYSGSIERTSFAEAGEEKGCIIFDVFDSGDNKGRIESWEFIQLPARPMVRIEIDLDDKNNESAETLFKRIIPTLPDDGIITFVIKGKPSKSDLKFFKAENMRRIIPENMNYSVVLKEYKS